VSNGIKRERILERRKNRRESILKRRFYRGGL